MKIIKPHVKEVIFHIPEGYDSIEKWLEKVGRICYKSENKITEQSASKFIKMLKINKHLSILEHVIVSAKIIADRGCSHELVRHRIASFAQESTRYCNYFKKKFGTEITVIQQPDLNDEEFKIWQQAMLDAEKHYFDLIKLGTKPEIARSVLPIALKAEIIITTNLREWIWIFEMRCSEFSHPIIKNICFSIFNSLNSKLPSIYDDQKEKIYKNLKCT